MAAVKRRTLLLALAALAVIVGIWVTVDHLVVTDAERIEVFLETVTGEVTSDKISSALEWVDTSRQPVEVHVMGRTDLYEDGETLETRARESMRRFMGQDLRILGENIDVEDDRATLDVRVINSQLGMVSATFDFRKRGEDWLISKVSVRR
jgi:hypothetical protein